MWLHAIKDVVPSVLLSLSSAHHQFWPASVSCWLAISRARLKVSLQGRWHELYAACQILTCNMLFQSSILVFSLQLHSHRKHLPGGSSEWNVRGTNEQGYSRVELDIDAFQS